ncbi:FemABX peptidyl transferase [Candidatus Methylopumilus universalis]|uniref:lipid II:glycine glycyltransferase FemX n=1 Tax=Candidatus Methylopumilus universalis TaxID=2588536 RepID=UPI003BEEC1BB
MRQTTLAPLPMMSHLFKAFFCSSVTDDELALPWCRNDEQAFWFSRSAWSLLAITLLHQKLKGNKNTSIWIPDFFCNDSLTLLRDAGVNIVFYSINEDMSPNLASCEILANNYSLDIFVLAHYFGQPSFTKSIVTFCENKGAWLAEDAVHLLEPISGVGEVGDFVIYSPHKHLPIPDGAVLILRENGLNKLIENSLVIAKFNEVRTDIFKLFGKNNHSNFFWVFKRVVQRLSLINCFFLKIYGSKQELDQVSLVAPNMTFLAKRLLTLLIEKLKTAKSLREKHANSWAKILMLTVRTRIALGFEIKALSYLASFSCVREEGVESTYDFLHKAGLPLITWPDLPPEVLKNLNLHQVAILLRQNLFYLPVHQSLSEGEFLMYGKRLISQSTSKWSLKIISMSEWESYWQSCHETNLLQSWQYGEAKNKAEGWSPKRFLIEDENENPIALVQILLRAWPVIGGIARLNRGPILLVNPSHDINKDYNEMFLKLGVLNILINEVRRQRCWVFQVAPEMLINKDFQYGLRVLGFKKLPLPNWASAKISLKNDENSLLMNLDGKWRNQLRKGEKLGVKVLYHKSKYAIFLLLKKWYIDFKNERNFDGLSEKLIQSLFEQSGDFWQFNLFTAHENTMDKESEPLGILVTISSGDTVIYLISLTNEKGRQMQANSVLLWESILHSKKNSYSWFDIGGLNEATPKGIAEFKKGLNATAYELVGEWRKWL